MKWGSQTRVFRLARLITGLSLVLFSLLILTDQAGLRTEYFALSHTWQGRPVFTAVSDPQLGGRDDVADVLVSQEIFSLRWQGWFLVEESGPQRFTLRTDEAAYLRIDQTPVIEVGGSARGGSSAVAVDLDRGIHSIEVGHSQTRGRSLMELNWERPKEAMSPMVGNRLVSHRPVRLRLLWRRLTGSMSPALSRTLGWISCLAGLILLSGPLSGRAAKWFRSAGPTTVPSSSGRLMAGGLLLGLFLMTFWLSLPYTAATADGDDVRYMDGALFNKQMGWNMNRYAHIYMLKGFIQLAQGDVFLASRWQWSFMFAVTVLALAVAVRALGSGYGWKTLIVVLFLLLSQPRLLGGIGAAYADYTAMLFVTAGLAVYVQGFATSRASSSRWHAFALGALTIGAAKSKEPGAIMLWFAFLLLWSSGRVDFRRFRARILWWTSGAVAAYLLLMTLDGVVLGDFWFSLRPGSFAGAERLLEAAESKWQLSRFAWLRLPWSTSSLRALSVLAVLAATHAWVRARPMELRLVALTPLVFMVMMIAVHPPTLTPRYLFPIIPITCFVGAMLVTDLTLAARGSARWKVPLRVLVLVILAASFGPGFLETRSALQRHTAYQRGELILYPWRVFEAEITEARPREIVVTNRLYRKHQMIGKKITRDRIARMFFHRRHLKLRESGGAERGIALAVGDREDFRSWLASQPDSPERSTFDPAGRIVLVRLE